MTLNPSADDLIVEIVPAKESDLDAICEIAKMIQIDEGMPEGESFLVSLYDREDYASFLKDKRISMDVARPRGAGNDASGIVGFIMTYTEEYAKHLAGKKSAGGKGTDMVNVQQGFADVAERTRSTVSEAAIIELLGDEAQFTVIKQVAIHPAARRRNVARQLYLHVLDLTDRRHIFAAIVANPRNDPSEAFHLSLGFTPVLQTYPASGNSGVRRETQVWYRVRRPAVYRLDAGAPSDLEAMHMTLDHAKSLYVHEDNLNWTKLGLMVTFFFALMAAAWVVMTEALGPVVTYGSGVLVAAGYAVLIAIHQKIRSGLKFMARHKETVRIAEAQLQLLCPGFMSAVWQVPRASATVQLLGWLPWIALTLWTVTSVLLVLRAVGVIALG